MTDGVRPACHEKTAGQGWRRATLIDRRDAEPSTYCFPEVASVGAIDAPVEHLVVATGSSGSCIHIDEEFGKPTWSVASDQSTLAQQLADPDVGPEDVGLSPSRGGDA
jgi:hypothetical protein